jgi:arylsulfatase A-like enzyme
LTDHIDIAASLVDIAGTAPMRGSDGRSLIQIVHSGPDAAASQLGKEVVFSEVVGFSMVSDGRYKLVVSANSQRPVELYDLEADPDELRNRVLDDSLAPVRQSLLENHLSRHRARMDEARFGTYKDAEKARRTANVGDWTGV